jgi:hypothetical protein
MFSNLRMFLPLVLLGVLFMTGCSATRLTTSWRDDSLKTGQIKKPMILAIVEKKVVRARLEDEFVKSLREMGVEAVQSYKTLPDLKGIDAAAVKANLIENGRDSVLAIKLVDTKKETVQVPGTITPIYSNFGSFYSGTTSAVYMPGYSYDYKIYSIQNNLYTVSDEKLVWTGVSESEEETGSVDDALRNFAEFIAKSMKKQGVF